MRKARIFFIVGEVVFVALFIFSSVMAYRQYAERKRNAEVFDEVAKLIRTVKPAGQGGAQQDPTGAAYPGSDPNTDPETDPGSVSEQTAYETYRDVYAANSDFVGWICIDGTNINYPVMQTPNSHDFYLNHGFDKKNSKYGVPYVQENCIVGESDNCIIYGHHMKDGSMFADLCKYESESFYREHTTVGFDTLSGFFNYEIVCVFKTSAYSNDGLKYYQFVDAGNAEAFQDFIRSCKAVALYDTGVSAEYGDKLITLSTCEYSRNNGRMVVVAKRITPPVVDGSDA